MTRDFIISDYSPQPNSRILIADIGKLLQYDVFKKFPYLGKDIVIMHPKKVLEQKSVLFILKYFFNVPETQLFYDKGKPRLKNMSLHLSISHSKELLAIYVSNKPIGIDIEYRSDKAWRVRHKFLSTQELEKIEKINFLDEATLATVCWSAKEAFYKSIEEQEGLLLPQIFIQELQKNHKKNVVKLCYDTVERMVQCEVHEHFVLAYTT